MCIILISLNWLDRSSEEFFAGKKKQGVLRDSKPGNIIVFRFLVGAPFIGYLSVPFYIIFVIKESLRFGLKTGFLLHYILLAQKQ